MPDKYRQKKSAQRDISYDIMKGIVAKLYHTWDLEYHRFSGHGYTCSVCSREFYGTTPHYACTTKREFWTWKDANPSQHVTYKFCPECVHAINIIWRSIFKTQKEEYREVFEQFRQRIARASKL